MAPLIPSAKATLSYPLYACDFDPLDANRLVVGGGGGAGRSGVGNKITVLDTSISTELVEVGEADLSKDEDNVTSLAVGQRKGRATLVYAGVNSSPQDVAKGKNTHFRVFGIEQSGSSKGKGKGKGKAAVVETPSAYKLTEVARSTLFQSKEKDIYQRIIRLSKPYPHQAQLGAVCTGLAKEISEIVLFDTSAVAPPNSRGGVQSTREAQDVDFIQTGDEEYLFAYCDVHDVYVKKITSKTDNEEPLLVYSIPASKSPETPVVPSFRAMRWLTKDLLLMLTNISRDGGVVLQILRIPAPGKGEARIAQSLRLPGRITKATGMAVANLTPPLTPSSPQDYTQFVIAIAGRDISLSLFKVDLQVEGNISLPTKIKAFKTYKNAHPMQITSLAFSNFVPPTHPVTASTPPQYLKLASVGVSNTVLVHTFPLFPVPLSVKRGQSKTPRYVIALPSTNAVFGGTVLLSIIGVLFASILIQGILEIRGGVPEYLGARNRVPVIWQEAIGRPYEFPAGYSSLTSSIPRPSGVPSSDEDDQDTGSSLRLPDFFAKLKQGSSEGVYVLKEGPGGVKVAMHDERKGSHGGVKWEGLSREQKERWKGKLKEAGHWAEGMGETVLKGVVFGEIAGAVGGAVAGAI
ncbi:hypothetical protein L207DRAFT_455843 [Hyaloscypha variabilis F]|uniref:Guanine nucleotide-exchange factor SEC12 n=1 Tax=Hyaloscypha variabilis (strain UAMH 11265 / GT02V1 / F) TaxID=1149755 RepID=A0A2J6RYT2_HYAVF|nr:hypothetical protein L207DRAFT_455843 [Hyaloscypha variabilis F]